MEESPDVVQEHVELIAQHEQEFLAKRSSIERVSDAIAGFAGSLPFVGLHGALFAGWFAVNTLDVGVRHFDPYPFGLLGALVSMEGIVLASFILMRQVRTGRRSDERDHLILQMLMLSEKEITANLRIQRAIAARLGISDGVHDKHAEALSQQTSVGELAQTIRDSLIVE